MDVLAASAIGRQGIIWRVDILNVVVDNNSAAQRSVAAVVVVESMDVGLVILFSDLLFETAFRK